MKWIIGAFAHETNNFSVVPTGLEAFRAQAFKTGTEIIEWARGTRTPISGFIDDIGARGDLKSAIASKRALAPRPISSTARRWISRPSLKTLATAAFSTKAP